MKKEVRAIKKFYSLIWPRFSKRGIILFIMLLFAAAILLPFPFLTQYLVDGVIANPDKIFAIKALFIIGGCLLGLQIFDAFYQYILGKIRVRLNNDISIHLRMLITKKLQKIKQIFFRKTDRGTVFHRYVNDVQDSQTVLFEGVTYAIIDIARVIFGIIALFILSPIMAVIVLIILPFYVLALKKTSKKIVEGQERLIKKRSLMYGFFLEFIRSITLVKAYVLNLFSNKRMEKRMQDYAESVFKFEKVRIVVEQVVGLIGALGQLIILIYGGYQIIIGNFTLGALMAFTQFVPYVFGSASTLVDFTVELERAYPPIHNILNLLRFNEEIQKPGSFKPIKNNSISFENVDYKIKNKQILKNVSFKIDENKIISIVGKSGSGKSSIFKMIEGFWYPNSGKVLVGNEDTTKTDIRKIRGSIGYVSQDSIMLKDTIYNNISLGKNIPLSDIKKYSKIVQMDSIIQKLPKKYDSVIDPEETNFSGGQLQRLSLVRALAQNKKILLLDEFSSEIDPATERRILKAIKEFKGKKTILIIAHDKSCVTYSDKILVIDNGRLVEQGNYRELSSKRSSFFNKVFS